MTDTEVDELAAWADKHDLSLEATQELGDILEVIINKIKNGKGKQV